MPKLWNRESEHLGVAQGMDTGGSCMLGDLAFEWQQGGNLALI